MKQHHEDITAANADFSGRVDALSTADWEGRLDVVVTAMREMSMERDPQALVRNYTRRIRALSPLDHLVALSRRDIEPPKYRITRSSRWGESIDPWKQRDRLPVLEGGLFGDLIYGDRPVILDKIDVGEDDPSREYVEGMGSLVFIPNYDKGVALNGVVIMRAEPNAFKREQLPEQVWLSNLFGRATHNLVLSAELDRAYREVDDELRTVADIQRSLLPNVTPKCGTVDLAAHYATSRRAGGDYYDVFPLGGEKFGIFIADVVGHGTPAAVMMAVTHSLAHNHRSAADRPAEFLSAINRDLSSRYTRGSGVFVTAFYCVYDNATREVVYSGAGHPPPLVKRCSDGSSFSLEEARSLPLGIDDDTEYESASATLETGDQIVFYTDGLTESFDPDRVMYGVERLQKVIEDCALTASGLIAAILDDLERFTHHKAPDDDLTLLVAKIR
ncbi:MAG: PP2C family protein-serine/threonine phosphatase [Phycisphaerales bacterium]